MNKLLTTITLLTTLSLTVNAEAITDEAINLCDEYSQLAGEAMKVRQNNIPLAQVYKAVKDKLALSLIKQAIKEPIWSAPTNKKRAVDEFANDAFIACIGAAGGVK